MKFFRAFFLLALFATVAAAADEQLLRSALGAYQQKDYARSANLFARAFESGEADASDLYNAACSAALADRRSVAFDYLERSIHAGYLGWEHLENDSDLASLHGDARWAAIVAGAKKNEASEARLSKTPALSVGWADDLPAEVKIAGLSKLWSEARYNFANFDLVPDLDWDAVYLENIGRVAASKSTLDYYRILQEVVARLHDGHSNVYPPMDKLDLMLAKPGLRTRLIDGKVIVTRVTDEALGKGGAAPGDELLQVDGVPVHDYALTQVRPWQGASTPQDLDARTFDYNLLCGAAGTTVKLSLRKPRGKAVEIEAVRLTNAERNKATQLPHFELRMLRGGVAHVILNSFGSEEVANEFDKHRDGILTARAVIFDIRENGGGNSSFGHRILQHFNAKEQVVSRWRTPQYRAAYRAWKRPHGSVGGETTLEASQQPYSGPVFLLTSPRSYSAAEDFAVAFRAAGIGKIVGEATGGSTGQPVMFDLPGGGSARICAKRDTFADGTEFVGVGVLPDVVVKTTASDIVAERDPVLERAIKLASEGGHRVRPTE